MQSLEKLKGIFADIKIDEDQVAALDEFFTEYKEHVKEEIQEELLMEQEENAVEPKEGFITLEQHNAELEEVKKQAETAFGLFEEDAKKAFEAFEKDAEKAFVLFQEDAEKAFDLASKDVQELYSEKTIEAIDDLYETIEEKVKEEFLESNEYKAFETIKDTIAPHILSEEKLSKGYKELLGKYQILKEENETSERKQIIDSLVEDFPVKESRIIREFIEPAKNTDEIYERFSTVVALLEEKIENLGTDTSDVTPKKDTKETPTAGWKRKSRTEVVNEEEELDEELENEEDFEDEEASIDSIDEEDEDSYEEDDSEEEAEESYQEEAPTIFNSKTEQGDTKKKDNLNGFKSHEQEILRQAFKW